jgi:glycine betaine/choline ABC-type transport system substrate-binding protein/actin-like ATPase involved in cell morphogenesis
VAIGYQLGVDLGTTFTAAALVRDGHPESVTLGNHGVAVPSVVFLDQNGLLIGEAAALRSASDPSRVAREFKRRVGDPAPILVGGVPIAAELLMARSLDWVVGDVSRTEGEPPAALAVTHPANWGEYKLDLLRQAVRHVGLRVDHLVPEPVAAASFYAAQRHLSPGSLVAVYDLGGGTFDAAVVRVEEDGVVLLGRPEGIERLGGIDFDHAVFGHVLGALGLDVDALDIDDGVLRSGLAVLRRDCVDAKEALSHDTDVSIPVMLPRLHTQVRLTRTEFEAMIRPALDETVVVLRRAVGSADVAVEDLTAVLLVGGSSRIPLVGQMIGAELRRPIAVDARPKDAIPMGAALVASQAAAVSQEPPAGDSSVLSPAPRPPAPGPPAGAEVVAQSTIRRRSRARVAVAVVAVVAVAAAVVVALRRDDGTDETATGPPTEGYEPAADGSIVDNFDLSGTTLHVGWKDQPEAELLGQITTLALEAAGAEVTSQAVPVNSDALYEGLTSGEVDLYWDYMLDVWRGPLGRTERAFHDAREMHEAVNEADSGNGVVWLGPTAFNSTYTFMVSDQNATRLGLASFSDLATLDDNADVSLCAAQDPSQLVDAVEQAYGLTLPDWQQAEVGELYSRIADGSCTLGIGVATDGAAAVLRLAPLEDDRGTLAAANAALGIRAGLFDDHPDVEHLFAPIARALDDRTIRSLNVQVAVGDDPREVAHEWLELQGFIDGQSRTAAGIAESFDLSGASFTVGSVGTDEQVLLGQITRLALEEAGAQVDGQLADVGTTEARDSLLDGQIDLYWEYLAKAWTEHLGHPTVDLDTEALFNEVGAQDAANGIEWFRPAGFNRGWAVVTTSEKAEALGIDSIADLEHVPRDDPEASFLCGEINDTGRNWIEQAYGFDIPSFEVVAGDIEGRVDSGECTFGMVRASSPWLVSLDLTVLRDDGNAIVADRTAVSVRAAVAAQYPQLENLVAALAEALTDETIRTLNSRVVVDGVEPVDVARDWLQEAGFTGG